MSPFRRPRPVATQEEPSEENHNSVSQAADPGTETGKPEKSVTDAGSIATKPDSVAMWWARASGLWRALSRAGSSSEWRKVVPSTDQWYRVPSTAMTPVGP